MPREATPHNKVRVKRDEKLRWVDPSEVLPGEETFPRLPRQPAPLPVRRIEFGPTDPIVPDAVQYMAETAAPNDIAAILKQMQQDMAAMRKENAALRDELIVVTKDVKRVAKGGKRGPVGLPKRRPAGEYPVPYYNPIAMDERFQDVPDQPLGPRVRVSYQSFRNGVFLAQNANQERVVRLALRGWGPDKPDRWKGDDLDEMDSCKVCGFRSFNRKASNDHLNRYTDHRFERHE